MFGIAVLFGLVLKFGNLALVLMDTAFWQKSFASEVRSTVPAYDLVSIVILAIPWCTGTIIGLSARAIEKTPIWFDYPNTLTDIQVNSGLVMPYVLRSLLGRGATAGLLVLIFMAITSTVSSYQPTRVGPANSQSEPLGCCLPWLLHGRLCHHARVRWSHKQLVHVLPTHHLLSWHPTPDIDPPLVQTNEVGSHTGSHSWALLRPCHLACPVMVLLWCNQHHNYTGPSARPHGSHRILLLSRALLSHHLTGLAEPFRLARVPQNRPHRRQEPAKQLPAVQTAQQRSRQRDAYNGG